MWTIQLVDHPNQLICILIFICQHTKKKDIAGQSAKWHLEPHLELSMILFNPSQGVISVCWLQSGGRNVSGLWPKIRSLFLRNLSLLSWWLNDRACIVLVYPGSAGRWLEDFLPCDLCAALREAAPKDKIQQEILRPSCAVLTCLSIKFQR